MGVLGKLFGAGMGFMFGGPLGAVIGGALGHQYDKSENKNRRSAVDNNTASNFQNSSHPDYSHQEYQTIFMVSLISMAAKIAKADGNVTREEVLVLDNFLRDQLRMNTEDRKVASKIFNQAKNQSNSYTDFAKEFAQLFRENRDMLVIMIDLLFKIAIADGIIDAAEQSMIEDIAGIFNLNSAEFDQVRSFYTTDTDKYYRILGCTSKSSNAEVKKAYRTLAIQYHPDKIISQGLPDDFMEFATEKLQTINDAYDKIKKERGI